MSTITVVIPTHDRAHSVGDAVRSVLNQEGVDVRLVVVDDGSTDDTADVLARIQDPRVTWVTQPHAGVSAARNRGVAEVSTEYVTFLDSDDIALDGWAAAMAERAQRGVDLFSCGAEYRYDDGRVERVLPSSLGPAYGDVTALFLAGTFLIRRELFDAAGGYRVGLTFGENSDLGMRLGEVVRSGHLTTESMAVPFVRVHARDRVYDAAQRYATATRLIDEAFGELSRDPSLLATHYAIAGVAASRLGNRREAVALLAQAVRHDPTHVAHTARLARAAVGRPPRSAASGRVVDGLSTLTRRLRDRRAHPAPGAKVQQGREKDSTT